MAVKVKMGMASAGTEPEVDYLQLVLDHKNSIFVVCLLHQYCPVSATDNNRQPIRYEDIATLDEMSCSRLPLATANWQ